MKPKFLDCPPRYTRASRIDVTPVDYACSVSRSTTTHKHDKIVLFGSVSAAAALILVLLIWG